jgi:hypothetical protein
MASYAYKLSDASGFSVAFAALCAITARVQGAVLFAHRFADVVCITNNQYSARHLTGAGRRG